MTVPGGYIAGDVLSAANMNLLPGGKMGYAAVTANQVDIITEVDLTSLTVTWTAVSARLYRVSFCVNTQFSSTLYAGDATRYIYITDGSNTKKKSVAFGPDSGSTPTVDQLITMNGSVVETGLSGSTTRKLRGLCVSAMDVIASATSPSYILVEDIGPA